MEKSAVIDAVRDFLDDEGYRYEYNVEREFLRLGFRVNCKLKKVRVIIDIKDFGFVVYAIPEISADKDTIAELSKYLTMANYGILNGNFELDYDDGEVRYKSWVGTEYLESLPRDMIDEPLSVSLMMVERYGDGIAAIAMGFSDAKAEIAKAEKSTREPASDDDPEDDSGS